MMLSDVPGEEWDPGQEQRDDLPPSCLAVVLLPVSPEVECGKGRCLGWGKYNYFTSPLPVSQQKC